MREKIVSALKTKYSNLGFGDKAFDGVASYLEKTVTDETQIETAISGVEILLKSFQGDIDKRVNDAIAKTKTELEKKPAEPKEPKQEPKDEPEWFKSYREKQDKETADLKLKLDGYEKEKTAAKITNKLVEKLKEKGVPESYYRGRNLAIENEDGIDSLVDSIETDYSGFKQELAEQGVIISIPKSPVAGVKEGEAIGKSIAEKRNTNTSEGVVGKKV